MKRPLQLVKKTLLCCKAGKKTTNKAYYAN